MPWKYDQEMGLMLLVPLVACLATFSEQEDGSVTRPQLRRVDSPCENARRKRALRPTTYREALWSFGPASRGGTYVSSYEPQKLEPNTKADARGAMDEPTAAVASPIITKPTPTSQKVILRSGYSSASVRHFAKPTMTKGKVAAEWGEAPFPSSSASKCTHVLPETSYSLPPAPHTPVTT